MQLTEAEVLVEPGSAPGDTVCGARLAATVASAASGAAWVRVAGCVPNRP